MIEPTDWNKHPETVDPICIYKSDMVITMPADDLAPNGARPSAGHVLITGVHIFFTIIIWLSVIYSFLLWSWVPFINMD